jgi:hypothetical protein
VNEREALSDVLDRIVGYLDKYLWFQSDHHYYAVALWVVQTYVVQYVDVVGMLWMTSPTRECGKSLVLDILEQLCWSPKASVNMSNSVLFRLASGSHTLLIDEVDNIFGRGGDEEQRALINAAYRRGRTAMRMGGPPQALRVEEFDVFTPIALAGIGDLPDPVASRCVPIRMQRKPRSIVKARFRLRAERASGELETLRADIEAAVAPLAEEIGNYWPELPGALGDRQQEIWEPMLAIADVAGEGWGEWARRAAVALHSGADETDGSIGIRLLTEIRDVFGDDDRLATSVLLERLHGLQESPWADWYGKPVTARFIAEKLKPFVVHSKTLRIGDTTLRGYEKAAFIDAWDRYLDATPATPATNVAAQGPAAEAGTETPAQHDATRTGVADLLHIVADSESGEAPDTATVVADVVDVSPDEGVRNVMDVLGGELVGEPG